MGMMAIKCVVIEAHELGGMSLDVNGTLAPTKGTASVELAGRAERATTAKPEVLEPWAESEAWRRLETLPLPPQKGSGKPGLPPQEAPSVGMHRCDPLLRESPSEGECRPQQAR